MIWAIVIIAVMMAAEAVLIIPDKIPFIRKWLQK